MSAAVIVPAIPGKLHSVVIPALLGAGATDVSVLDVSGSDESYWETLRDWWDSGHDLIIVEHDIEVAPETLAGFEACPELWCAHSYPVYWGGLAETYGGPWGLGCVRFRAELQAAHPDLLAVDVPQYQAQVEGVMRTGRFWMNLDAAVSQWLRGPYLRECHRHLPDVTHHHHYDYEGAYVPDEVRAKLAPDHPLRNPVST